MSEFSYTNYHTIYECNGTVNHEMSSDSCFHTVTKDDYESEMDNHYTIRFYKSLDYIRDNSNNNFCPFSEREIRQYLHILRTYFSFYYNLKSISMSADECENTDDYNDGTYYDIYELKVHIDGFYMKHKFLLKMIRVLYEYPFNMAMSDTMLLMKQEKFRTYGYFNIYMMIGFIFAKTQGINVCDDQFVCSVSRGIPQFIKKNSLINKIKSQTIADGEDTPYMNDVIEYKHGDNDIVKWLENRFLNSNDVYNYSYWTNPEMINERCCLYEELIKYFVQ